MIGDSARIGRFAVVGVINTLADAGVFFALVWWMDQLIIANVLSYACGAVVSFLLNRFWTFRDAALRRPAFGQLVRFTVLNGVAVTISTCALLLASGVFPLLLAKAIAILVGASVSYIGMRHIVFRF